MLYQSFIDTYKWNVLKGAEFQGSSSQLDEIPRRRRYHTAVLRNDVVWKTIYFSELKSYIILLINCIFCSYGIGFHVGRPEQGWCNLQCFILL